MTARSRLFALGMLLVYLASVPVLGLLWVSVAYRRFPQIGFRDQLYQVGLVSTTILGGMLVVLSCFLFASAKRSSFEGWALFAWPFVASIVVWLVGLVLGIALYRRHRWAAIRTARYCVIVVAGIASVIVGSLLVKTTAQWVQYNYL